MSSVDEMRDRWRRFAREDALHYVASNRDGWTAGDFYAMGADRAAAVLEWARPRRGRMLEIGCGAGRMLVHFAPEFERVDGVDIAPEMLAAAREAAMPANVELSLVDGASLAPFEDAALRLRVLAPGLPARPRPRRGRRLPRRGRRASSAPAGAPCCSSTPGRRPRCAGSSCGSPTRCCLATTAATSAATRSPRRGRPSAPPRRARARRRARDRHRRPPRARRAPLVAEVAVAGDVGDQPTVVVGRARPSRAPRRGARGAGSCSRRRCRSCRREASRRRRSWCGSRARRSGCGSGSCRSRRRDRRSPGGPPRCRSGRSGPPRPCPRAAARTPRGPCRELPTMKFGARVRFVISTSSV